MNALRSSLRMLMGRRPPAMQVGAICVDPDNGKVLLVTSRGTGRWIIPKGWPMEGRTLPGAAAQEAWEEAGVEGRVGHEEIGRYVYDKEQESGFSIAVEVRVFLLKVTRLVADFPESDERSRRWVTPAEAARMVAEPGLKRVLRDLSRSSSDPDIEPDEHDDPSQDSGRQTSMGGRGMIRMSRGFHVLDKDLGRVTHAEAAQRHAFRPVWRLGLAMLLVVAGLVAAMGAGAGEPALTGLVAGLVVAGWLGLAIGSNDVANSLGPAVGAGAIRLFPGLVLVALAEIAGASLAGDAVTSRLAHGIFDAELLVSGGQTAPTIMLSALLGAAVWITAATGAGLPVSTSHSIVGGIAGAGIAALGGQAVHWSTLGMIASAWMIAPLVAAALAGMLVILIRQRVLDAPDRGAAAMRWLPPLVGVMTGGFAAYLVLLARMYLDPALALPVGVIAGGVGLAMMRRIVATEIAQSDDRPGGKRLFRPVLLVAVVIMGFAHGANDVANVAGPLSVILSNGGDTLSPVPITALLLAGLAIALGTLLFGRRLVVMVGSGITRLNAGRAFCVSLATAVTVLTASSFGLPVSTTHVAIGGIFGVGFAREWLDRRAARARSPLPAEESRRRLLIRRSHVATISAAWIVTVPATGFLGAMCCLLILRVTGG